MNDSPGSLSLTCSSALDIIDLAGLIAEDVASKMRSDVESTPCLREVGWNLPVLLRYAEAWEKNRKTAVSVLREVMRSPCGVDTPYPAVAAAGLAAISADQGNVTETLELVREAVHLAAPFRDQSDWAHQYYTCTSKLRVSVAFLESRGLDADAISKSVKNGHAGSPKWTEAHAMVIEDILKTDEYTGRWSEAVGVSSFDPTLIDSETVRRHDVVRKRGFVRKDQTLYENLGDSLLNAVRRSPGDVDEATTR